MSMHRPPSAASGVELLFLGTGDAFASHGRFQSGYVIEAPECRILMDPGPTALCAMKRNGLKPLDIDIILVSHLHGDHFGGLPFFLLEYIYESPRESALTIAGPRHLEERTWRLFKTMFPGSKPDLDRLIRQLHFITLEPELETTGQEGAPPGRLPIQQIPRSLPVRANFSSDRGFW